MRLTHALLQVALALLADPSGKHWGYELSKKAGIRSGVMYPMLTRMVQDGWLADGWEDLATIDGKRPPRRYYELTQEGKRQLGGLVVQAHTDARFSGLNLRWV